MNVKVINSTLVLGVAVMISPVSADLPLTVENLMSDKGKMSLNLSLSYLNTERRGIGSSEYVEVQTGNNSVFVPSFVGENVSNTDALVSTVGMRYGITGKTEVLGKISGYAVDSRSETVLGEIQSEKDSSFFDAWIGVNHIFRDDTDNFAILGFAELQLAEKQSTGEMEYGKSLVLGSTIYQTYDPIVLSLTSTLKINQKKGIDNFKLGNSFTLNPSVGFAVNDKVTLTTGLNWRMNKASTQQGEKLGIRKTKTNLDLGVGFALSKNDTLNLNISPQVSGDGDVQVSFNWLHRFRK